MLYNVDVWLMFCWPQTITDPIDWREYSDVADLENVPNIGFDIQSTLTIGCKDMVKFEQNKLVMLKLDIYCELHNLFPSIGCVHKFQLHGA